MLWAKQWRRLAQWFDRRPLWVQVVLFPPAAPAALAVAAVCVAPRTSALAGLVLWTVYGLLVRQGITGWEEVGRNAGWLYLVFIAVAYVGAIGGLLERAIDRLPGRKLTGSEHDSRAPSSAE